MFILTAISVIAAYVFLKWQLQKLRIGSFKDRYILITGCDTGFGYQLAKELDDLGFNVFAGCLTEKGGLELKQSTSDKLNIVSLDVTSDESIENAFTNVKSKLPANKGLYGLVNNAGIGGPMGHVEMFTRKDYEVTLNVNLYGMIEMTRVFLPLLKREKGRIVNMTSTSGRIAMVNTPYVVSKFAAEGYSDSLRRDLYRTGVSVHIIEPGFFRTNILNTDNLLNSYDKTFNQASKEVRDYYGERYLKIAKKIYRSVTRMSSTNTELVVEAYTHALCSVFPKYRYKAGKDANTLLPFLWNVPEWLSDYLLARSYPVPDGAKKR